MFHALRLVTAIRAERGRIVAGNRERLAGGVKLLSVLALRANVARQVSYNGPYVCEGFF